MRFSQDFIEKVRESTNIVDIIGQHTQLKRAGTHRMVGLCPFHGEKTPSFSVSEDKQTYFCFGCKKGGNVYHFTQDTQGLSFPEAVEYLAARAGIEVPKEAVASAAQAKAFDEKKERGKLYHRINQFAASYFQLVLKNLAPNHPVRAYLKERGLHSETIERFQLGYAADDWESLVATLNKKNIPLDASEALGLIRRRSEGKSGHYDIFRHRLMFPIVSLTGQVLGFGGRVLGDGQPKYLNSPESEVFHKGKVFYGLNESAKHIRVEDRAIVVEGYMDFLALHQAGVKPVVATLGTALTQEHARLLKRMTKNIIVLFDGDEAGQDAAERSLPLLLQEGLIPRGLTLPEGLDPDEFVQAHGLEALEARLKDAPELFTMILDRHLRGYRGTSAEKVALLDRMTPFVRACSDRRLKELYMGELAERLSVEVGWVARAVAGEKRHEPSRSVPVSNAGEAKPAPAPSSIVEEVTPVQRLKVVKAPRSELYLLNVSLMKDKYYQLVKESGVIPQLSHEGVRQVFARLDQLYRQMPSKFDSLTALLVSEVEPPETVSLHLQPPLADLTEEGAEELLHDCARKIKEANLKVQSKQLRANLRGQDQREQLEKLEQIMNIHRNRHSLNKDT
ncbi:MAG: DNA primase [Bdellovibrionales bacterium]